LTPAHLRPRLLNTHPSRRLPDPALLPSEFAFRLLDRRANVARLASLNSRLLLYSRLLNSRLLLRHPWHLLDVRLLRLRHSYLRRSAAAAAISTSMAPALGRNAERSN